MSERCERTSERTSEWPNTYVSIFFQTTVGGEETCTSLQSFVMNVVFLGMIHRFMVLERSTRGDLTRYQTPLALHLTRMSRVRLYGSARSTIGEMDSAIPGSTREKEWTTAAPIFGQEQQVADRPVVSRQFHLRT